MDRKVSELWSMSAENTVLISESVIAEEKEKLGVTDLTKATIRELLITLKSGLALSSYIWRWECLVLSRLVLVQKLK